MLIWNAWALIPSQFPHPSHSFLPRLGWWELALFVPQTSAILALALPHPYQGFWPAPWREMSDISASLLKILRSFWLCLIVPSVQPQLPSDSCQMSKLSQVWLRIHVTVSSILSPQQLCATVKQQPENMVHFPGGRQQYVRCLCPRYGFVFFNIRKNTALSFIPFRLMLVSRGMQCDLVSSWSIYTKRIISSHCSPQ